MTEIERIASCVGGYDPQSLPVAAAQQFIDRFVEPLAVRTVERLALRAALGRVLARDLVSPIDVPAHDNSAMDGYALRGADLQPGGETRLRLVGGTRLAGAAPDAAQPPLEGGCCLRIMTGAVMPPGADTVVPQEFCRLEDDRVVVPAGAVRAGDNRRLRGEDLRRGGVALARGKRIGAAELGLAASLGLAELPVHRRLRVAFFSSGNELRSVGEPLDAGCVYDSNRYTLHALLRGMDVEMLDLGVVRDEPQALEDAFGEAAAAADAVITSGGVSVGEADYTKQIMARLGDVAFWRIAMRPGRPMAFGSLGDGARRTVLFGLPGNPVAVMVTFILFVRPALQRLQGRTPQSPWMLRARSRMPLRKKPGRSEYQRGCLQRGDDGELWVDVAGNQGSGVLRSMSEADGLVVLHHAQGAVAAGDWVDVLPLDGLI
jgi:molybdopterin molybdotransferase